MTAIRSSAIILAAAFILTSCGGDASSDGASDVAPAPTESSAPSSESSGSSGSGSAPSGGTTDGDLEWSAIEFGCDFVDDVEAVGRVTNNGPGISTASYTITVLQDGRIVATLNGFVSDLESGQTKTVEFISTDDCLQGDFEYEIQTDFSMGGSSEAGSSGSSTGSGDGSDQFTWDAVDFGCDFIEDVEARGRVTNNGSAVGSASFTITVLQDGRIVATLTGFVGDLDSGQTKTVEFISTDDCLQGDFEYEIQTDFAM